MIPTNVVSKTKIPSSSPPQTPASGGLASSRYADNADPFAVSTEAVTPESEQDSSSAALASVGEPFS